MINQVARDLVHRQIIIDLTIRTLERDRKYIEGFKMREIFDAWFDVKVLELHAELKKVKGDLGKMGAKIQSNKLDGDCTVYTVLEKGRTFDLRYMNIVLKNRCEDEIGLLLGLDKK